MDIGPALVTHAQAAEGMQPGESALDDPTIAAKTLAGLDAAACDAWTDAALAKGAATTGIVVTFVEVGLVGPTPRSSTPSTQCRDRIDGGAHHLGIMCIRRRERNCERYALLIDHEVVLGADFPSVGGIAARLGPPFGAATAEPSSATRSHLIRSSRWSASSSARHTRGHTPACCQATNRRQQVVPEPHPSSRGSSLQGIACRSTNSIPVRAARSSTRGRPPRRLPRRFCFGRCGAMIAHNSSESSSAMLAYTNPHSLRRCLRGFEITSKFRACALPSCRAPLCATRCALGCPRHLSRSPPARRPP